MSEEKTNYDVELRNSQKSPDNQTIISQNNSKLNEIFYSLQNDFQNIQIEIEEKAKMNKKLYEDFNNVLSYLEKEIEVTEKLKKEKEIYEKSNKDLIEEKNNFDQYMLALNNSKEEYLKEIDFYTKQNNLLDQQIQAEENEVTQLEQERNKYKSLNKEIKIHNNEKTNIIKINDEAINYFEQQLKNTNTNINKMVNMINEREEYYKSLQKQYEEVSDKHKIIENKKFNNDKIYNEIVSNIQRKEANISESINALDSMSGDKEQLYDYNTKIYNDLDRLQNQIYTLAEQNQKLLEKIKKYQNIEEIINKHIKAKKQMNEKLQEEQNLIESKIGNELKEYFISEKQKANDNNDSNNKKIDEKFNDKNGDIPNNDYVNNNEKIFENKSINIPNYLKSINSSSEIEIKNSDYNFNNNRELNQKDLFEKTYNDLLEELKKKSIGDNYNYLKIQKDLELENEYE